MRRIKKIVKIHPYLSVIIFGLFMSAIGILMEYIINKEFIREGIYGLVFYYVIALLSVKYNLSKKK